jgi:hypothetical protein
VRKKKSITKRENLVPLRRKRLIDKPNINLITVKTKNTPRMNPYKTEMQQMKSKKILKNCHLGHLRESSFSSTTLASKDALMIVV